MEPTRLQKITKLKECRLGGWEILVLYHWLQGDWSSEESPLLPPEQEEGVIACLLHSLLLAASSMDWCTRSCRSIIPVSFIVLGVHILQGYTTKTKKSRSVCFLQEECLSLVVTVVVGVVRIGYSIHGQ